MTTDEAGAAPRETIRLRDEEREATQAESRMMDLVTGGRPFVLVVADGVEEHEDGSYVRTDMMCGNGILTTEDAAHLLYVAARGILDLLKQEDAAKETSEAPEGAGQSDPG